MRCRLSTTCVPDASGVEPTTSPVLPPCGTMDVPRRGAGLDHLRDFARWSPGRTTASALPRERLRQSCSQALRSPSVSTLAAPTSCAQLVDQAISS